MTSYPFIVGTFNTPYVFSLSFTPPTSPSKPGHLSVVKRHSAIGSHSWLHLSSSKRNLYATAWTDPPALAAYAVDSPTEIRLLNTVPTHSRSGYVCASETHAYSAGGATGEVFALDPETGAFTSAPSPSSSRAQSNGDSDRTLIQPMQKLDFVSDLPQKDDGSTMDFGGLRHGAHSADLSPDGTALYIADIGRNCIWAYSVDSSPTAASHLTLGSKHIAPRSHDGPRHVHPHPTGNYVYSLQEHSSVVDVFETSSNGTKLRHVQGVRIIPQGIPVNEFWADEVRTSLANAAHPQFLYASTRGLKQGRKGYVAVYKLTPEGLIDGAEVISASGSNPGSSGTTNGTVAEARDDDQGGLVAMWETPTSGGWANAIQPGPSIDGVEYIAMTDSEVGFVFVLGWDAEKNELREVARIELNDFRSGEEGGDSKTKHGAATAVWL